ncbi:hypothetical protein [Cupriavidus pauculus]|uniref:hypothetical protein n=1 Tax=Cupriavidus pauculus TaxID=82633 RepID=UPI00190FD585|nr:hypothetical protein [Cupriavidus pauculus]
MENQSKPEQAFRSAFERLVRNVPRVVKKGTPVSQNNVAKEAGQDPSALKLSRYPTLIAEIKTWIEDHKTSNTPLSPTRKLRNQRKHNRSLHEKIAAVEKERDVALSMLAEADVKILELILDNEMLRAKAEDVPVTNLKPSGSSRRPTGRPRPE